MRKSLRLALINAGISGAFVFSGAFADGHISKTGIITALSASVGVFLYKMKEYFSLSVNKKAMKGVLFEFL